RNGAISGNAVCAAIDPPVGDRRSRELARVAQGVAFFPLRGTVKLPAGLRVVGMKHAGRADVVVVLVALDDPDDGIAPAIARYHRRAWLIKWSPREPGHVHLRALLLVLADLQGDNPLRADLPFVVAADDHVLPPFRVLEIGGGRLDKAAEAPGEPVQP